MSEFWKAWAPWLGGGGLLLIITLILSYIARPVRETIADLQTRMAQMETDHNREIATVNGQIEAARREIIDLRESNFHMRVVFTALSVQYNNLRENLIARDPTLRIPTIQEIVSESHVPLQSVTTFLPNAAPPPPPTP